MSLALHHRHFASARTARGPRAPDLVGALLALWRAERRGARVKGASARRAIDTRPAPDPYKDGPEWPRTDIRMPRTSPLGPERRTPPRTPNPVAGGSVAASKMRFSPSSPPGTRRRRPTHSGEPPKHAGGPRHPQHRVEPNGPLDTTPRPQRGVRARPPRARRACGA